MPVLLNEDNQNFWAFETLVMEYFLSSSLGGTGTFEEVCGLAQKKAATALERASGHEKQHWQSKKKE